MLQSVPTRREAYEPQALNQEEASKPFHKPVPKVAYAPSKRFNSKVTPFPLRRRRLILLVIRKAAFQLMNDEKVRKQAVRVSLLLLPVVLSVAFTITMLLGSLAQAQAAQNGNPIAQQAEFQRQQMYHASINVPQ